MATARYTLLFRGKVLTDHDADTVRQKLGELLKLDVEGLEQLFSGRLITLKRGLCQHEADKYRQVLEHMGAEVLLQPDTEQDEHGVVAALPAQCGSQTEAVDAGPLDCPRCGHSQLMVQQCGRCKMDLRLHIMRQRRKLKAQRVRLAANEPHAAGSSS
jgi:hypothetical protein